MRLLRKEFPEVKIILGGQHSSFLYKEILQRYDIDGIFIGEPEESIIRYAERIGHPERYEEIPGFAYNYQGKIRMNPIDKEANKDLDMIPVPAYHLPPLRRSGSIHSPFPARTH